MANTKENLRVETITIVTYSETNKKKDGTLLMTKAVPAQNGQKEKPSKPYLMAELTAEEYPNQKIRGFNFGEAQNYAPGTKLEVTLWEEEYNGYKNMNFSLPKKDDLITERFLRLEKRMMTIELSFDRRMEEFMAKLKADIVLEKTGTFHLEKNGDYDKFTKGHPLQDDDIPLEAYNGDF